MKIEISTEEAGEVLRLLENAGSNALAVKELKKKTFKEIWG